MRECRKPQQRKFFSRGKQAIPLDFSQEYQKKADAGAGFRKDHKTGELQMCIFWIKDKGEDEEECHRKRDGDGGEHEA